MKYLKTSLALIISILLWGASWKTPNPEILILERGHYFDGTSMVPFAEIIIEDGKIKSISDKSSKTTGKRIDVTNKYIIPGLIDGHVHYSGSPVVPYAYINPLLNSHSSLMAGITTNIDLFMPEWMVEDFRKNTRERPENYSTSILAGPILTAPGGHGTEYGVPTRTITSEEEAEKIVKEIAPKVDLIKVVYEAYSGKKFLSKNILKKVIETAHAMNKKAAVHINVTREALESAELGADVIVHLPWDEMTDAQSDSLKSSGVIVIPTITVMQSMTEGMDKEYMSDSLLWHTANETYLQNVNKEALLPLLKDLKAYKNTVSNFKKCLVRNVKLIAGTDAGNYGVFYGYSLHHELEEYNNAGMKQADILNSATKNFKFLFPDAKKGEIKSGYDADLVVLNANPLDKITNTKAIFKVIHNGKIAEAVNSNVSAGTTIAAIDTTLLDFRKLEKLPEYISTYSDSFMNGNSTIEVKILREAGALELKGKVVKKGFIGFAGVFIGLNNKMIMQPVDLSDYESISFEVQGNIENYKFKLASSLVTDYNYHSKDFPAGKEWNTITVPFTELKQTPWGKQIKLDLKTITHLVVEASAKDQEIDLRIRNICLKK